MPTNPPVLSPCPDPREARERSLARRARAHSSLDDGLPTFLSVRPRLFAIARRMLGNSAEAEDVMQDVWVRWQTTDRRLVRNATGFLVATTTRLSINVLQSARWRHERPAEAALSEPVEPDADPESSAEQHQALSRGVLRLLERLTPVERSAYILREAFDYPYRDIAKALRLEEANARQVVTRARRHLVIRPRTRARETEHRHLLEAFAAARAGDLARLAHAGASSR